MGLWGCFGGDVLSFQASPGRNLPGHGAGPQPSCPPRGPGCSPRPHGPGGEVDCPILEPTPWVLVAPGLPGSCPCPGCNCESNFTDGTCEDLTGRCYCRPNFSGERCDVCAEGFTGFPSCYREHLPGASEQTPLPAGLQEPCGGWGIPWDGPCCPACISDCAERPRVAGGVGCWGSKQTWPTCVSLPLSDTLILQ